MSTKIYKDVFPNMEDWPIFKLSEDRKNFIAAINQFAYEKLAKQSPQKLADLISSAVFAERNRIKSMPWKVDPPNDAQFWSRINKKLIREVDEKDVREVENNQELLRTIINHYAEEIVGNFKIPTFQFARQFLTVFFSRILNSASANGFFRSAKRLLFGGELKLFDRFKVHGDMEHLQNLFKKGTVIVVPTHFSNLDSILLGFVMDQVCRFPAFSYGAGLNLFNSGVVAHFMNRLGAYRVDRRKKNAIYLEVLKSMSSLSIQRGTNTLFFPGGTRSRSGSLETRLKMGLLGTATEAQRANFQRGTDEKIFIVPLVMSYHFVLEGQSLIEQYLRTEGKERYTKTVNDEFYSLRSVAKFIWQFLSEESEITLSFGKPMDVVGNFVDYEGESFDKSGRKIPLKSYFQWNNEIKTNEQREGEYTKILAERIVERYFQENVVLSSHLIAFAIFKMLEAFYPKLDVYALMRLPADDYVFPYENIKGVVGELQKTLIAWQKEEKIKLSEQITGDLDALIAHGAAELGIYHLVKPIEVKSNGNVVSDNFPLLYFYHNRLEHYGLEKYVNWEKYKPVIVE
jgi:glycerol-3-phosphate O-acyltransferase